MNDLLNTYNKDTAFLKAIMDNKEEFKTLEVYKYVSIVRATEAQKEFRQALYSRQIFGTEIELNDELTRVYFRKGIPLNEHTLSHGLGELEKLVDSYTANLRADQPQDETTATSRRLALVHAIPYDTRGMKGITKEILAKYNTILTTT